MHLRPISLYQRKYYGQRHTPLTFDGEDFDALMLL